MQSDTNIIFTYVCHIYVLEKRNINDKMNFCVDGVVVAAFSWFTTNNWTIRFYFDRPISCCWSIDQHHGLGRRATNENQTKYFTYNAYVIWKKKKIWQKKKSTKYLLPIHKMWFIVLPWLIKELPFFFFFFFALHVYSRKTFQLHLFSLLLLLLFECKNGFHYVRNQKKKKFSWNEMRKKTSEWFKLKCEQRVTVSVSFLLTKRNMHQSNSNSNNNHNICVWISLHDWQAQKCFLYT